MPPPPFDDTGRHEPERDPDAERVERLLAALLRDRSFREALLALIESRLRVPYDGGDR